MHFILSRDEPPEDQGAFWLKPYDFANPDTWGVLQNSGAGDRGVPGRPGSEALEAAAVPVRGPPVAPFADRTSSKGGTTASIGRRYRRFTEDDEPFGIQLSLRRRRGDEQRAARPSPPHAGGPVGLEPPAEGDKATRAVIMIMPFPNACPLSTGVRGQIDLFGLLPTTFNSLISQARFKPRRAGLGRRPGRLQPVPDRPPPRIPPRRHARAVHDCLRLARRLRRVPLPQVPRARLPAWPANCQWFLKQYFALPSEGQKRNTLFEIWTPEAREEFAIHKSTTSMCCRGYRSSR